MLRSVVAGALVGAGLAACMTAAERRAVTVADCVAQLALDLPNVELHEHPAEVTSDDLRLAVFIVDGVRACRRGLEPDGGAP